MSKKPNEYQIFLSNLREVMRTRQGKDVMWHILGLCDVYSPTTPTDRRSVGLDLIGTMYEADPTMYPRLLLEFAKKEGFDDAESNGTQIEE